MVASNTAAIFLFIVLRMIGRKPRDSRVETRQSTPKADCVPHCNSPVLRKRQNEVPENSWNSIRTFPTQNTESPFGAYGPYETALRRSAAARSTPED